MEYTRMLDTYMPRLLDIQFQKPKLQNVYTA